MLDYVQQLPAAAGNEADDQNCTVVGYKTQRWKRQKTLWKAIQVVIILCGFVTNNNNYFLFKYLYSICFIWWLTGNKGGARLGMSFDEGPWLDTCNILTHFVTIWPT